MTTRARNGKSRQSISTEGRTFRMAPIARAVALTLAAGGVIGSAQAQQAFSPAWFAQKGAAQSNATATGLLPNGLPANTLTAPQQQSQAARDRLQQSITNLNTAAQAIALQQALQQQARQAALVRPSSVPDGLGEGGLKIDENELTRGWINANAPTQSEQDGRVVVDIEQTADKAILNWETFNVGRNTTVNFDQDANWAVLNRVNDPNARPSEIQGQINAPGTVFILNRNGILFEGSSQVNVRNLVAAAANMTDTQFRDQGLYGANAMTATFTNAGGAVNVEQGALIQTHEPKSVTDGGGYVMLLGTEVENAGEIVTRKGQTLLAAGDSFIIRKGVGTDANQYSTVRGNEIMPQFTADTVDDEGNPVLNPAGKVVNSGLITAREGDITLAGREVRQEGVAVATTTVNARGTVHLLNSQNDARATVTLAEGSTTAVVIEEDGETTALDSQRDALIAESATLDQQRRSAASQAQTGFDNYSTLADRRHLSRIEIVGGSEVNFEGDSLTLATGGQLAVTAGNSQAGNRDTNSATWGAIQLDSGAMLDVSGSVGVQVAMESNNIQVNVQGNELRDAPLNRDAGTLFNRDLWVDRRDLVFVPAGTDGYDSDRYYTAGGLLEVSGYLGNTGHGIGEWTAQGGTVSLITDSVVTQAGSLVNIAGGTLDVATGYVNTTWLRGADGRIYAAGEAPADIVYAGVYTGYDVDHARWGVSESFYNPLIAPQRRLENGYTVGRDAGTLEIGAANATLEGDIDASVYNSGRQIDVRPPSVSDGYKLSQTQAALAGRLLLRTWDPTLNAQLHSPRVNRRADVVLDAVAPDTEAEGNRVWLNLDRLNEAGLGGLRVATLGELRVADDLVLAPGGALDLTGNLVLDGNLTARGGSVRLSGGAPLRAGDELPGLTLRDGLTIDTRGLWTNTLLDPASAWGIAFRHGGSVSLNTYGVLALESGSRIDASGGGALLADGSMVGGNGGDVSLSAGGLVVDGGGEIASYGFGTGGKLSVVTPAGISIGGSLTETRGLLAAGESAIFDVTLAEETTLPAGSTLTFDLSIKTDRLPPGVPVPPQTVWNIGSTVVGPDGWQVPTGGSAYIYDQGRYTFFNPGDFVPPGTNLYAVTAPVGYVLPAGAFPNGYPIIEKLIPIPAGTVLSNDLVLSVGSVIPRGAVADRPFKILPTFDIADANAFFQQGFSAYELSGAAGLIVQPGTEVDVAMPVYRFTGSSRSSGAPQQALAGDALAEAVELALPPLFAEDPVSGTLKQRAGADLSLIGAVPAAALPGTVANPLVSGALIVGEGAVVTVDPGRHIDLTSKGQIVVEGSLVAPGGDIAVVNTRSVDDYTRAAQFLGINFTQIQLDDPTDNLSVWIGEQAVLDAAGRAYTALDAQGNPYGVVLDGGAITLGSNLSWVVTRPGALLDVSGASAGLMVADGSGSRVLREVASHGGDLTVNSHLGFVLDGEMRADAGGAGASGGHLSLVLETPIYPNVSSPNDRGGRLLTVTQAHQSLLADDLAVGEDDEGFVPGRGSISAEQIEAGGFDSLSLWGRTAIAFDGDVDLSLGRSLVLSQGALHQLQEGASVTLAAPYVLFDGGTVLKTTINGVQVLAPIGRMPDFAFDGSFSVDASLIDLVNTVRLNFDQTALRSSGDLRFLAPTAPPADATVYDGTTRLTDLRAWGDLELAAAQIYPASEASAAARAGVGRPVGDEPSRITILGAGDTAPAQPYSVYGQLTLSADVIEQGGVLRAPFGELVLNATQRVELLPGSITGVGTRDLVIPVGGTVDGVEYTLNGVDVLAPDLIGGQYLGDQVSGQPQRGGNIAVRVTTPSLVSHEGALVDLAGGGEFVGGAFVTGRGGSVDTLLHPRHPGGQVYAIVPGTQPGMAPVAGGYYDAWTGAVPEIGQQITIPDGVPGLPAGTYTLMPANYALLPGAWRVELGGDTDAFGGALAQADGSYRVSGVQSIANTGIRDSHATLVTLASGELLRSWSSYNEQSYSAFQLAQAQTFGTLRPLLEADGRRLIFSMTTAADSPANSTLQWNGEADFSADEGGYAGSFVLGAAAGTTLVVTGEDSTTVNGAATVTVAAAEIGKLQAPNLFIGGVANKDYYNPNIGFGSTSGWGNLPENVVLERGVQLAAGQVVLAANNKITLEEGATISTLGHGQTWLDSSSGVLFGPVGSIYQSAALLLVSNGRFALDAPSGLFGTSIELQDGVTLYSEGTVGFYSDLGVSFNGDVNLGARDLSLAVPSFNIGSAAALDAARATAGELPAGMNLDQAFLDRLFAGIPAQGVPALESLSLAAAQSINFFGSVSLDTYDPATGESRLAQLVLNTPALYGYGDADDSVSLITDTLVWNNTMRSVEYQDIYETRYQSADPGALLAGGAGNGTFRIDANTIVIGNPTLSKPDTTIAFDRLMLGFAEVDFNAAERITGNAKGTVSVYQSGADPSTGFDPASYAGSGGNLRLNTPLLTGDPGSVIGWRAGGALSVVAPAGSTAPATTDQVGATLSLHGGSLDIASAIVLPSGKLTLTADGDLTLAEGALLDVSGRRLTFFDVTRDTWGGDIELTSLSGNIVQQAGATIDVSADNEDAGTLSLTALDVAGGLVLLNGTLHGHGADGHTGGGLALRAQRIGVSAADLSADFAALNTQLSESGFFGARAFAFQQGDLVIGNEVQAHEVSVSTDGGSLTVNGRIDASGAKPGSIRLAARDDLRLSGSAVLDAHGSELQVDSYGQAIEAKNRGTIELTSAQGWLRLDDGATLDVSAPGVDYGRVTLNARRDSETGGDILVDASGRVNVQGAKSIAVNGFWTYSPTDADGSIVQDNAADGVAAGAVGLDQIDAQNQLFHNNALGNGALQARLAGLKAYGDAYHLRPGVEIVSSDASGGQLTVKGDLDLAGYRYGPDADRNPDSASYGGGEPLALVIRAAGDLDINGSITDGFGLPKASPDDSAILLSAGQTLSADYTLPEGAMLAAGTRLGSGAVLPFDVELQGAEVLLQGQVASETIVLGVSYVDQYGTQLGSIFGGLSPWGELLMPVTVVAGQVDDWNYNGQSFGPGDTIYYPLGAGATLHAGTILSAGTSGYADLVLQDGAKVVANRALPQPVTLAADYMLEGAVTATGRIVTPGQTFEIGDLIPAGTALPSGTTVGEGAALPFDFYIAATTWQAGNPFVLAGGYTLDSNLSVAAGTVLPSGTVSAGVYALESRPVWAVAPMLAAGSQSASLRLVGGADLAAADTRTLLSGQRLAGAGNVTLNDPRLGGFDQPIYSVLRTGTGDLDILAGGDFAMDSLFGVYTAGSQSDLPAGNEAFKLPRAQLTGRSNYDAALNDQATWFPDHGGDLLVQAQGNLSGHFGSDSLNYRSDGVQNWLWRQGGEGMGQQPAWSINFGSFVMMGTRYNPETFDTESVVGVAGFTGLGALGGGNVTLLAGGDAGVLQPLNTATFSGNGGTNTALVVAVGATGRVTDITTTADGAVTGGTLVQTGGGDLRMKIGGGLNAVQPSTTAGDYLGVLTNLRGDINVAAGSVGSLSLTYGTRPVMDPRGIDIYAAQRVSRLHTGPVVAPGDGAVDFRTRGDLVLSSFQDPTMTGPGGDGRSAVYSFLGELESGVGGTGYTWFSLWTPQTAVSLFSAGGDLMPFYGTGLRYLPAQFEAVAGSGSLYYGSQHSNSPSTWALLPSATGQLELLAMQSIHGAALEGAAFVGMSGARAGINDLPNPFKPAWILAGAGGAGIHFFEPLGDPNFEINDGCNCASNTLLRNAGPQWEGGPTRWMARGGYFAFQEGDAPSSVLHADDDEPIRLYAVNGDIVGATLGGIFTGDGNTPVYLAAKAAQVRAGRDIVGFGVQGGGSGWDKPGVIMNANATDVSIIEAGRDLFYANAQIAGPGVLEVSAGRNFYQGDVGQLVSLGPIVPGDDRPGADIVVQAGATDVDWAALAGLYLDPVNQADITSGLPLADQPGKVAHTYHEELAEWLSERFGFAGSTEEVLVYFDGLPSEQQRVFLRTVYYAELLAGGREYNDVDGPRFGSYLRGRQMIATLFPEQDAEGNTIERSGDYTAFGGAGIQTRFGGDIQMLVPAGQIVVGVQGAIPPATSGLITQGAGDIRLYSQGSILLGLSRIMTTFGGHIQAWSAEGDINAGRGSKTTLVYTPPKRAYDQWGNVTLSPQVPSTGAGIATLNPIPEVPPGDIDLIAPLGVIDAGEAGIRVSGNVNLAALQVLNADNIQVQGEATGLPVVAAINVGALTSASAAANSAVQAAQDMVKRQTQQARPSIISVEVLGFGEPQADARGVDSAVPLASQSFIGMPYDPASPVQFIGVGQSFDAKQLARLTPEQQQLLRQVR